METLPNSYDIHTQITTTSLKLLADKVSDNNYQQYVSVDGSTNSPFLPLLRSPRGLTHEASLN